MHAMRESASREARMLTHFAIGCRGQDQDLALLWPYP